MAKSSLHFEKVNGGNHAHNDRTEETEPEHILPKHLRGKNEVSCSAIEANEQMNFLFEEAKVNYQNEFGQKLQSKNFRWEAVANLNQNHTMEDAEKLVKKIEKETGMKCVQYAIHRDEGHIKIDKQGKEFAVLNIHLHMSFFSLDRNTGKQLMRMDVTPKERKRLKEELEENHPGISKENMTKTEKANYNKLYRELRREKHNIVDRAKLSRLQTLTAAVLGMKRGDVGSNAVRLDHKQYRAYAQERERIQIEIQDLKAEVSEYKEQNLNLKHDNKFLEEALDDKIKELEAHKEKANKSEKVAMAKVKDLNEENRQLRSELKANKATRAEYAELEAKVRELKTKIKAKDLTIQELQSTVAKYRHEVFNLKISKGSKPKTDYSKVDTDELYFLIKDGEVKVKDVDSLTYDHEKRVFLVDGKEVYTRKLFNFHIANKEYALKQTLKMKKVKPTKTRDNDNQQTR